MGQPDRRQDLVSTFPLLSLLQIEKKIVSDKAVAAA